MDVITQTVATDYVLTVPLEFPLGQAVIASILLAILAMMVFFLLLWSFRRS